MQTITSDTSVTIDEILITEELYRRPTRPPDYAAENRALVEIAECMARDPKYLPQQLTDLAVQFCKAGSAGISLIQEDADGEFFSWVAISGLFASYVGGRTPRHFSPCGTTLERKAPQLFYCPARLFVYFNAVSTPIIEGLVVPFELNGRPAGTIWIVGHDEQQQFDAEDVRLMTSLARFTGAALQTIQAIDAEAATNSLLQVKVKEYQELAGALSKSEADLLELNYTLEQRVQERTKELQRSNQELAQFAYVASHDLKAPLRAINQLASWVIEDTGALLPEASHEHLRKLMGRAKRLETLLDDLLAYSRAGRQRHPVEWVNTSRLVSNIVELIEPPPNFVIDIAQQMPELVTERIPLETIFRNLIANAIRHHTQPTSAGHIEIGTQDHGEFFTFAVKDDGPGIDPAFHERIFEMFHTLRPRDQVEGSGMGLSVVKKIIESRGGKIEVESTVGNGSTFRFTWLKSSP